MLLATHHTGLALAVADHVIVLSDGAVTAEGPPDADTGRLVMARPRGPTVTRDPIAVPDSTAATFALLRELRRGRGRKQAASAAYWAYLAAIIVVSYGGSLIVTAYRALHHPPPATAAAPRLMHAAPAALTALALLVFLVLLRDALWRGPVTVPQATADWLLGTPVSRRRLLRPRFRWAAAGALLVGAVAGIAPAAALVALGLGGPSGSYVLRLAGAAMMSMGLLFAVATGLGGLIERYPETWRWVRAGTPVALGTAVLLGGLAAWAGFGRLPSAVASAALWSGPWGWAAQPVIAAVGHAVPASLPGSRPPGGRWPWRCWPGPRWPRWPARTGPRPGCPPPRSGPGPAPWA